MRNRYETSYKYTWLASRLQGENEPLLNSLEVSFLCGEAPRQNSVLSVANKRTFPSYKWLYVNSSSLHQHVNNKINQQNWWYYAHNNLREKIMWMRSFYYDSKRWCFLYRQKGTWSSLNFSFQQTCSRSSSTVLANQPLALSSLQLVRPNAWKSVIPLLIWFLDRLVQVCRLKLLVI